MRPCILTVDDSVSMRQLIRASCTTQGYDVVEAIDGLDALAKARILRVDIVLTDQHMPGLEGTELIARLRALPGYATVPILMLTIDDSDDLRRRCKAAGATGLLQKPVSLERLRDTLSRLLRK